jgi:hypothetical protein
MIGFLPDLAFLGRLPKKSVFCSPCDLDRGARIMSVRARLRVRKLVFCTIFARIVLPSVVANFSSGF